MRKMAQTLCCLGLLAALLAGCIPFEVPQQGTSPASSSLGQAASGTQLRPDESKLYYMASATNEGAGYRFQYPAALTGGQNGAPVQLHTSLGCTPAGLSAQYLFGRLRTVTLYEGQQYTLWPQASAGEQPGQEQPLAKRTFSLTDYRSADEVMQRLVLRIADEDVRLQQSAATIAKGPEKLEIGGRHWFGYTLAAQEGSRVRTTVWISIQNRVPLLFIFEDTPLGYNRVLMSGENKEAFLALESDKQAMQKDILASLETGQQRGDLLNTFEAGALGHNSANYQTLETGYEEDLRIQYDAGATGVLRRAGLFPNYDRLLVEDVFAALDADLGTGAGWYAANRGGWLASHTTPGPVYTVYNQTAGEFEVQRTAVTARNGADKVVQYVVYTFVVGGVYGYFWERAELPAAFYNQPLKTDYATGEVALADMRMCKVLKTFMPQDPADPQRYPSWADVEFGLQDR